jgi:hypothetical protein
MHMKTKTKSVSSPVPWQRVAVFVSSTFSDMHAERDYLVKRVFPDLQDWCERRRLRLVDMDLRWGVTEADATENHNKACGLLCGYGDVHVEQEQRALRDSCNAELRS